MLRAMEDAGEAGSLLTLPAPDFRRIDARLDEYRRRGESSGRLGEFFGAAEVMSRATPEKVVARILQLVEGVA